MRVAFFCTCNENYYQYAIISMLSYKKHHHYSDIFIVGNFSEKIKQIIENHGINCLNIDLNNYFPVSIENSYPSECIWWFIIPEMFYFKKYDYVIRVDVDTLCLKPIPDTEIQKVIYFGGLSMPSLIHFIWNKGRFVTKDNKPLHAIHIQKALKINFHIKIEERRLNQTGINRIQVGVLICCTKKLFKIRFYNRLLKMYKLMNSKNIYVTGDDSLFALFCLVNSEIQLTYINNIQSFRKEKNVYIGHMTSLWRKPWDINSSLKLEPTWTRQWKDILLKYCSKFIQDEIKLKVPCCENFPLKMFWYNTTNFDDLIGNYIVKKITGYELIKPEHSSKLNPSIYSVGSIIHCIKDGGIIWGSGIMYLNSKLNYTPYIIQLVRGPLTSKRLKELECGEIKKYGDPALILPRFFNPPCKKKYSLGIIPHYVDNKKANELFSIFPNIKIIDITQSVENVILDILQCEHTLSSSLHGIIVSVAYKIPTRWIILSNSVRGNGTKFFDFFLSILDNGESYVDKACRILRKNEITNLEEPFNSFSGIDLRNTNQLDNLESLISKTRLYNYKLDIINNIENTCPFDSYGLKLEIIEKWKLKQLEEI